MYCTLSEVDVLHEKCSGPARAEDRWMWRGQLCFHLLTLCHHITLHCEAQPAASVLPQLRRLLCHQEAISCCLPGDSANKCLTGRKCWSRAECRDTAQLVSHRYQSPNCSPCFALGFTLQVANNHCPRSTAVVHSNRNVYTDFRKSWI